MENSAQTTLPLAITLPEPMHRQYIYLMSVNATTVIKEALTCLGRVRSEILESGRPDDWKKVTQFIKK